jgi:(p)ppGpp synthase/HD superfamily hydrolase
MIGVAEVEALARDAHEGQVDKIGVPYFEHVKSVALALTPFGPEMVMAGLLHDIVEDTPWTLEGLRSAGVPEEVLQVVGAVTNRPGESYQEKVERIARDPKARLVKIADNAHNSRADRAEHLSPEHRERLRLKYRKARKVLWAATPPEELAAILWIVNPELGAEMPVE